MCRMQIERILICWLLSDFSTDRASDNMLTVGVISPPLEQIAPPVTDACPTSEKLIFG